MVTFSHFQISLAVEMLRERSGLSQNELVSRAGLPPDQIKQIEAGELSLDYLTATRVAQVLGISLAEIAITAHEFNPVKARHRYEQLALTTRNCRSPC